GDDQWLIVFRRQNLIVRVNGVGLVWPVEIALRQVHIGGGNGGAQILKGEPIGRERGGIGLNPDRRFLAAADAHQAYARQLRNLLRQTCIGQVLDLGERERVRGQG